MIRQSRVQARTYHDSVSLMRASRELSGLEGVAQAFAAMGTPANKRVLAEVGLLDAAVDAAAANDLVIVIEAVSQAVARAALDVAGEILDARAASAGPASVTRRPRSLHEVWARGEDLNLMLISVPGPYAALEAARAIARGMHVFLFSDNVPLEAEKALKAMAVDRGLLMMGPGCGTAIINGVALGFANAVRRGPVGIVGASGTGLQELTVLLDRGGSGVSQAIGVGGRDLSEAIGGAMMRHAIGLLGADAETEVVVLISKPPAPAVKDGMLEAARATGKPVIVNLLGDPTTGRRDGVLHTDTLADTAAAVLRQVGLTTGDSETVASGVAAGARAEAARTRAPFAPGQRYIRGLFSGGSLCDEAMDILSRSLPRIYSNIPLKPECLLDDAWRSREHSLIDLGEEEFTQGRPHPMIDTRLREERILAEVDDPEVAVLLLDVVLGFGSGEDPARGLAAAIQEARAKAAAAGRHLEALAHVCGTEGDPQGLVAQEAALRNAGVRLFASNAQAARAALALVEARNADS